jgi:hypothetical protein
MIPIGDVIFGKKGAATQLIDPDDKVVDAIHETIKTTTHSMFHIPSISDWLGVREKIEEIANEMHTRALLTPDPNDDKINFLTEMYSQADKAVLTHFSPVWFKEIIIYITAVMGEMTHNAVQTLLKWIYSIVSSVVLWTPEFLFNNDWFSATTGKFSIISIAIVIIFTMIEGIKKILRMKHTPFRDILKKLPISLAVSASCPFLITNGVHWLNKLTHLIMNLSKEEIGSNDVLGVLTTAGLAFEPLNILLMLVFAILFLALCVPMTFFHAKRWFDLLCAGVLTPFMMSCYLFNNTEHLFRQWLSTIKGAALKQLVYAGFVSILGLLMFATPNPTTFAGVLSKLIIMLGGCYRLAFPPNFVKNLGSGADDKSILDIVKSANRKRNELDRMKNEAVEKSEDTLIKAASVAGKVYRKWFK